MQIELGEMKSSATAQKSNNKIALQENIIVEKQQKLKTILGFAMSAVEMMTSKHLKLDNCFYFSGSECGIEFTSSKGST